MLYPIPRCRIDDGNAGREDTGLNPQSSDFKLGGNGSNDDILFDVQFKLITEDGIKGNEIGRAHV